MVRRNPFILSLALVAASSLPAAAQQCCLSELFAGCGSCFRRPQPYAMPPVMAPLPQPPGPVMVPVARTSYVPETTYRTEMKTVPVTTYKPSCEIDPCTGCPRECMQPVTQYVQQAVNVPVTQYRAVTTTQYVQVPAGYGPAPYAPAPLPGAPLPPVAPGTVSPFVPPTVAPAPAGPGPQAWVPGGGDVRSPAAVPSGATSIAPPAIAPTQTNYPSYQVQRGFAPPTNGAPYGQPPVTYAQPSYGPVPTAPGPTPMPSSQPITNSPAATPPGDVNVSQRPVQQMPPNVPPLEPIPEIQRSRPPAAGQGPAAGTPDKSGLQATPPATNPPSQGAAATQGTNPPAANGSGMPTVPGTGPTSATGAFPRLLEPTGHTTSWQPAASGRPAVFMPAYPTAALPTRLQQ